MQLPTPAQTILGTILVSPEYFVRVRHKLRREYFADPFERRVYGVIEECADKGIDPDLVNVSLQGAFRGTDAVRLSELLNTAGYADIGAAVLKLVEEHLAHRFNLLRTHLGTQLGGKSDPIDLLDNVERMVQECRQALARAQEIRKSDLISGYKQYLKRCATGKIERVPTGFPRTDKLLGKGLPLGDLSIIGGEPGSGKTSFLLHIALAAARAGTPVAFIEGEMTVNSLLERAHAITAGVPAFDLRTGLHPEPVIDEEVKLLESLPLSYEECTDRTLTNLKSRITFNAETRGARLIIVDYLQVFAQPGKGESEYTAVSAASASLRQMALRLNIHILAASSLNRREAGPDGSPGLHSLRSSGQTGHDAALVMLLTGEQKEEAEHATGERNIKLQIVKNRTGPRGTIHMRYELGTQRMKETAMTNGK